MRLPGRLLFLAGGIGAQLFAAEPVQPLPPPATDWAAVLNRLGPPPTDADLALPKVQLAPPPTPAVSAVTSAAAKASPVVLTAEAPADSYVSLGRFIRNQRDALYSSDRLVTINYEDEPLSKIVRKLATAAGINYIMAKTEDTPISISQKGNPFMILEQLIDSQGMGLIERKNGFLITAVDRVTLVPRTYHLKHIHMDRDFSFRESTAGGGAGAAGGGSINGSVAGAAQNASGGGSVGGVTGGSTVTSPANLAPPRSVNERSQGNTQLFSTLERILEFGLSNALDPNQSKVRLNEKSGESDRKAKAIYHYDADSNELFVVATEQQHAWVDKWLGSIDNPTRNVQIAIQFISTGKSNDSQYGIDWSGNGVTPGLGTGIGISIADAAAAVTGGTSTTTDPTATASTGGNRVSFGPLKALHGPGNAILSTDLLNLTLHALVSNGDTRTTKRPTLTALTNREVVLNNTTNQPVVLAQNSGSTSTGTGGGSTTQTSSSNISNENIGTVTRILPRVIDGDLISLAINIEVTNLLRTTVINGNLYPIISKTGFTNEVKLRSGYSVVIGGLEELVTKETVRKAPLLGDMPIFGFAFRDVVKGDDVTNLSLVISVRIIDETGETVPPSKVARVDLPEVVRKTP